LANLDELLTQWAEHDVPPVPKQFDQRVHSRVNRVLLVTQVLDLLVRGFPYAIGHFAQAVGGLVFLTLSGRFPEARKPK
jgi:hypothetical protein